MNTQHSPVTPEMPFEIAKQAGLYIKTNVGQYELWRRPQAQSKPVFLGRRKDVASMHRLVMQCARSR